MYIITRDLGRFIKAQYLYHGLHFFPIIIRLNLFQMVGDHNVELMNEINLGT